jgi:hypothetical protein
VRICSLCSRKKLWGPGPGSQATDKGERVGEHAGEHTGEYVGERAGERV